MTGRSNPLPPLLTTLVSLHLFATNSFHMVTSTMYGISRASVSRAVTRYSDILSNLSHRFVKFPVGKEAQTIQRELYNVASKNTHI